jgi:hypothetical protein
LSHRTPVFIAFSVNSVGRGKLNCNPVLEKSPDITLLADVQTT